MRLTDGAWIRYDIPQDKLPLARRTKAGTVRTSKRTAATGNRNSKPKSEPLSQSQHSQIEEPEPSQDDDHGRRYTQDEMIESNWSYSQSDKSNRRGKLERIEEDQEEEEVRRNIPDLQPLKKGAWAEPGFFESSEKLEFKIWRDGY